MELNREKSWNPTEEPPQKYTRKRGLEDGEINLLSNAESILRKINALSSPYPGAHFYAGDGYPIIIEKARPGGHELLRREPKSNKNILCVVHPDDEVSNWWHANSPFNTRR